MNINELITDNVAYIEAALEKRLAAVSGQCGDCPELAEAMKYAVLDGGKRVRPFLCIEFCKLFGGTRENAESCACAIEFIHSYSLVHDDMPCMDNDMYRRGKLSVHAKFGEATALLTGDALLTLAFEAASEGQDDTSARAVSALAKYAGAGGMCGGQAIDLKYGADVADKEIIATLRDKKTAALLRAAAVCGVISAHGSQDDITAAATYATSLGNAFQMRDDILDRMEGGSDKANGRATVLTSSTLEAAEKAITDETEKAVAAIKKYNGSGTLADFARYLADRKK